ncbi:hypothetical protein FEE95_03775 [Maribacter algarum]|uniref:Membrane or secreted protein n=1 Tax=Maribacter algarum (ex Zhang et al. 2020) TaxID=2578118 RepID=A0A5S3PU83_9FLAO|nr:hypothetical protein [Maribacter algarum]TMM58561.1 hypothetical protein FEE95_03775 [Maribacter algarum]
MKRPRIFKCILLLVLFITSTSLFAQMNQGVYLFENGNVHHELKVAENYLIHSVYEKSPAKFIKTLGGFYSTEENMLKLKLEFNSDYQKDSLRTLDIPMQLDGNNLVLEGASKMVFVPQESNTQDLDGAWLFATRGPDEGQERRGESRARKTLKFLMNGRFQWIAYQTETFKFSGTGGGSYSSKDGVYTEIIEYFSRDNSRVGASLKFDYEITGDDWHHTGKNSKGEPMYEIWAKRK